MIEMRFIFGSPIKCFAVQTTLCTSGFREQFGNGEARLAKDVSRPSISIG